MRRASCLLLLLALSFLGCEEKLVVSGADAQVDARIAPRVTFTDPPMNSAGPYPSWEAYPYGGYAVLVRFNKLMESASVRRGIEITSSSRPITVNTWFDYGDGKYNEQFVFSASDAGYYQLSAPRVGEVFTVRAASALTDVNGNVFAPSLLGTIEPEPHFRVRSTNPAQGGVLLSGDNNVVLTFNSDVDTSIRRFITIDPPYAEPWAFQSYGASVALSHPRPLPGVAHTLRVAAGSRDTRGNALPGPFQLRFRVEGMELLEGGREQGAVPLSKPHRLRFSRLLDTATVRSAVRVAPEVAGGMACFFHFYPLYTFEIQPWRDYAPNTRYTVTIDTTLRSADGVPLAAPVSFSFTTDAFRVTEITPQDGAAGVSTSGGTFITFSGRLDRSTFGRAFSISPPAEGIFSATYDPSSIYFYPSDTLRAFTTYTVKLDTAIRSLGGYRIDAPLTFSYTTGGQ